MTTYLDIRGWLERAPAGTTHMVVATDTFDYSDYPVYVAPSDDAAKVVERLQKQAMTKVMEVYSFRLPLEPQLEERRAFHVE